MAAATKTVWVEPGKRYRATLELSPLLASLVSVTSLRAALTGLGASNVTLRHVKHNVVAELTWRGDSREVEPPIGIKVIDFSEVK